ncbi:hypothetical protein U1Q18_014616 [Sarracenia purpurea var. burkii]
MKLSSQCRPKEKKSEYHARWCVWSLNEFAWADFAGVGRLLCVSWFSGASWILGLPGRGIAGFTTGAHFGIVKIGGEGEEYRKVVGL